VARRHRTRSDCRRRRRPAPVRTERVWRHRAAHMAQGTRPRQTWPLPSRLRTPAPRRGLPSNPPAITASPSRQRDRDHRRRLERCRPQLVEVAAASVGADQSTLPSSSLTTAASTAVYGLVTQPPTEGEAQTNPRFLTVAWEERPPSWRSQRPGVTPRRGCAEPSLAKSSSAVSLRVPGPARGAEPSLTSAEGPTVVAGRKYENKLVHDWSMDSSAAPMPTAKIGRFAGV
jgi:hypothetical protein